MKKEQLLELRRLAEAATYGPWIAAGPSYGGALPVYCNEVIVNNSDSDVDCTTICSTNLCDATEDMEYIAALNPVAVLELLDFIDELLGK